MSSTVTATTAFAGCNQLTVYAKLWSLVLPSSFVLTLLWILVVPVALLVGYGALRLMTSAFTELRELVFAKATQGAARRIALETFQHLHGLSLRFHLERQTGGMSRDIERGVRGVGSDHAEERAAGLAALLHPAEPLLEEDVGAAWAQLEVSSVQIAANEAQIVAARLAFDGLREEAKLLLASYEQKQKEAGNAEAGTVDVCCELAALPFASNSTDLVILPHVLEFSPDAHQILREVERILPTIVPMMRELGYDPER